MRTMAYVKLATLGENGTKQFNFMRSNMRNVKATSDMELVDVYIDITATRILDVRDAAAD